MTNPHDRWKQQIIIHGGIGTDKTVQIGRRRSPHHGMRTSALIEEILEDTAEK